MDEKGVRLGRSCKHAAKCCHLQSFAKYFDNLEFVTIIERIGSHHLACQFYLCLYLSAFSSAVTTHETDELYVIALVVGLSSKSKE